MLPAAILALLALGLGAAGAQPLPRPESLRRPGQGLWPKPSPLPPFSPPLPTQFPRTYELRWFDQPVDHFNLLQPVDPQTRRRRTFKQRLLFHNASYGGAGSPVIFYTGAEGSGVDAIWDHSGWIIEQLAANLSALVVFAEHRFFGASMPFGDAACALYPTFNASCDSSFWPNATRLGLLSEEQALQDFAMVAHGLREELDGGWESPFITVGGSLAGEISTWFRIRYPHLIDMALAASAPILGYPGLSDPDGWYRVVTEAFGSVCEAEGVPHAVEYLRSGFSEIARLSTAELSKRFKTCTPAKRWCDSQVITGLFQNWAGNAAESAYPPARSPVAAACHAMKGATSALQAWEQLLAPIAPSTCLNVTWKDYCFGNPPGEAASSDAADAQEVAAEEDTARYPQNNLETNGWNYLACTTEVHPIGSNNVTDFLPPAPYDQSATEKWCQTMFQTFDLHQPAKDPAPTQVWMDANQMPWGCAPPPPPPPPARLSCVAHAALVCAATRCQRRTSCTSSRRLRARSSGRPARTIRGRRSRSTAA